MRLHGGYLRRVSRSSARIALHRDGLALLQARPEKSYSLCDAVSFVVMRNSTIGKALTTDRHFAQEGFVKLL
jgi:uncharacterized protein